MALDPQSQAQFRVLVVEDDPLSGKALRRLLLLRGWDVRLVATLADALKSLAPPPDFIILDLMLPDGNGEEVLRKVRDEEIPSRILVCSGTNDVEWLERVRVMGPDAMVQKPINFEAVCRIIEGETRT
jgi:DNA-binding response OmpR family regulator